MKLGDHKISCTKYIILNSRDMGPSLQEGKKVKSAGMTSYVRAYPGFITIKQPRLVMLPSAVTIRSS